MVLAGGAESLSNVPIPFSRTRGGEVPGAAKAKHRSAPASRPSRRFRPRDLAPVAPAIAEYTTGLTMGESCEKMAKENDISRRAQDEIALLSHQRAAAAAAEGRFAGQIVPVFPPPRYDRPVARDNGVRADSTLEALAALRRSSTAATARSPPATPARSPTAARRCC